ncbi:hypothetical protein N7539_005731 [Penicillium diatomitis]|uniref:DUF605-domain-containing protein n=1 Tax=Penicillium diatomitis TaxID=2819901 RepID=A0A9W9X5C3_9EURO|nr:uncharacterized protein N7539_005731 [Penicillium diatomitis]KAJ5483935.1 hypothetical protein N7539_005731 [Penicillium diatomitis]
MTSNIPAALRSADIGRFAIRAAQIEKAKPVIAYWCHYHIVNQIIERGLHNSDDEVKNYTISLVEKLEQFKSENSENETVTDNDAASAYVEQFGIEIFNRAEAAMTANKVTKQTADTFQAAAIFLELCQIWGELDPEIAGRVKFAKYHAVRIVKAIRAGEDPNETNPAPKSEEEEEVQTTDQDVQAFDQSVAEQATKPRQPSVEEIPDEADRLSRQLALQSNLDESLHPSRTSSQPRAATTTEPDIPSVPSNPPGTPGKVRDVGPSSSGGLDLPSTPGTIGGKTNDMTPSIDLPDTPGTKELHGFPGTHNPNTFQSFPPPSATSPSIEAPNPTSFYDAPSTNLNIPPPTASSSVPAPSTQAPSAPAPAPSAPSQPAHSVDDHNISLAQKHARWAVSALTFDDVNTAIKELKSALKLLGSE